MERPKVTVLFLDDSDNMREFFSSALLPSIKSKHEITCVTAANYKEAQEKLNGDITVAVLDYCLGEKRNGLDFYRYARSKYKVLPQIIFSGEPEIKRKVFQLNEEDENLFVCEDKNFRLLEEMLLNIIGD